MTIIQNKIEIRKQIKQLQMLISESDKNRLSDLVFVMLKGLNEWEYAKNILFYHSLPDELPTIRHIDSIHDKNLFLPKIVADEIEILPYSKENLTKGAYNIYEPDNGNAVSPQDMDLIIVPGVAFDNHLNRLGRGKGYYDRLLKKCNAVKIGVCYDFQLLETIPCEPHDIKMDILITPYKIIK